MPRRKTCNPPPVTKSGPVESTKKESKKRKAPAPKRAKVEAPSCPICCEAFTKQVRKPVVCPLESCKFAACKACVMKYLREDTYEEAHCMSCRNPWSDAFVRDSCTRVFWRGPFKDHVNRLFMDRERNALPQTQEWMTYFNFKERADKERRALETKISKLRDEFRQMFAKAVQPHNAAIHRLDQARHVIERDLQSHDQPTLLVDVERLVVRRKDGQAIQGLDGQPAETKEEEEKERKNPVSALAGFQCPKEACRGFINGRGQCGTCLVFICAQCRQTKAAYVDPDHECKEEDVESVKFLRRDSKPCPSCGAPIHKISGCSHMWCTACHTAFNWSTMKIMNAARAHNPHMVQWLVANGGNPQTRAARRAQPTDPVFQAINDKMEASPRILSFLPQLWALHNHFLWVIEGIQAPLRNSRVLRDLRLKYLRGLLGETQWESAALAHQKKVDRVKTKVQLMETFMLGADALARCNLEAKKPREIRDEAHRLREFFNRSWEMAYAGGEVGSVKRQISANFYWYRLNCTCFGNRACTGCSRQNI